MSNKTYESDQNLIGLLNMIQSLNYLELTALEHSISQRRYAMRKEAGKPFESIEKVDK